MDPRRPEHEAPTWPVDLFRSVNVMIRGADGRTLLQMRDGSGADPWTWGFWGGSIEDADRSVAECAAREIREELRLDARAGDFRLLAHRGARPGQLAALVLYAQPIGWRDLDIREGAGAGFFWRRDLSVLAASKPLREHLAETPALFLDQPTAWASGDFTA